MEYSVVSLKQKEMTYPEMTYKLNWKPIPQDHSDPNVRMYFPGDWVRHPVAELCLIFPKAKP